MARIELWNGDICDLEVDAIVSPAATSLWMSTGVAGELKRAGGDEIEFAAIRQAPATVGTAVVTPAGKLAARYLIHAVSLERDRRTSESAIDGAARSAMARARELGLASIAFPALGTGIGGFPMADAARVAVHAVRDELRTPSTIEHVVFALRGAAAYEAFAEALSTADAALPDADCGKSALACLPQKARRGTPVSLPLEPFDERREALVEAVAREIRLRGLTGPAVHFLEASRPYRPLGAPAMLFFDPVLRDLFGGETPVASELMCDDAGIEALIDRLEELDEADGWDA